MKNRKVQILCGLAALALAIGIFYATRENDPVYQGKRLSEHLATLNGFSTRLNAGTTGASLSEPIEPHVEFNFPDATAREAIHAVGTNALPMLVRMLGSRDSSLGLWLEENTRSRPFLKKFVRTNRTKTWVQQIQAAVAFHELGSRALPAAPAITRLLDDPQCAPCAMISLIYIHPKTEREILSLTNVLRIKTRSRYGYQADSLHFGAILALGAFGTNASAAIPLLCKMIASTNQNLQAASAVALQRVGVPPETGVPLIMKSLAQAKPSGTMFVPGRGTVTRAGAFTDMMLMMQALERYGRHASNALPMLSNVAQAAYVGNIKGAAKVTIRAITMDMDEASKK